MFGSIRRLLSRWRLRIEEIRTSRRLKRQVIVHEAGHALAAWLLPAFRQVIMVSIVPTGPYLGYTLTSYYDEEPFEPGDVLQAMVMSMAGMAAESLLIGEISEGGQDDMHGVLATWLRCDQGLSGLAADSAAAVLIADLCGDDDLRRSNAESFAAPVLATFYAAACILLRPRLRDLRRLAKTLGRKKYLEHDDILLLLGPRTYVDIGLIFGLSDGPP